MHQTCQACIVFLFNLFIYFLNLIIPFFAWNNKSTDNNIEFMKLSFPTVNTPINNLQLPMKKQTSKKQY